MHINKSNEIDVKRLVRKVTLIIPAQNAKLSPPVGPILGQVKIKVKDFCTLFNSVTSKYPAGLPLPVIVYVYKNESFSFLIKTPFAAFLIKNSFVINENKGVTFLDLHKIALIRQHEYPHLPFRAIFGDVLERVVELKINIID